MLNLLTIDLRSENDVVLVRQKARTIAAAFKFDAQDQARIATAVSEIARNTFQYAGGGKAEFRVEDLAADKMLVVALQDLGRGIPNLNDILDGKYVSQTGMGLGIIGAKRLMDYFDIQSVPGKGTTVVLGKKIARRFGRLDSKELNALMGAIERTSNDPYEVLKQQNQELLNTLQELRVR